MAPNRVTDDIEHYPATVRIKFVPHRQIDRLGIIQCAPGGDDLAHITGIERQQVGTCSPLGSITVSVAPLGSAKAVPLRSGMVIVAEIMRHRHSGTGSASHHRPRARNIVGPHWFRRDAQASGCGCLRSLHPAP